MLVDRMIAMIAIVFSVFFLVMSLQIEGRSSSPITPGSWPAALMIILLVLSIILLIRTYRQSRIRNTDSSENESENGDKEFNDEDSLVYPIRFFVLIGVLTFFVAVFSYTGFIFASLITIYLLTMLFGMKKISQRLLTSALGTAGFVLVFTILLNIPFPRGIGVFRTISMMFY